MIAYIYDKPDQTIYCKILNVKSISTSYNTIIVGEDVNGGSSEVQFSGGSDYIILQNPIDKNIGDVIDLTNLVDERTYFTKGKDIWYLEKINNANTKIESLETGHEELKAKGEELQCFSLDLQYQLDIK